MKRIIQIIAFSLFATALVGLMGFIFVERGNQQLRDIEVRICRQGQNGFLNEDTLYNTIAAYNNIKTLKVKQVHTDSLEELIHRNPYVENVDVFVNIDNQLMVNVEEKAVVLRIFNRSHNGYYIDENAGILPLSTQFSPRVLIANGYIDIACQSGNNSIYDSLYSTEGRNLLGELFTLTKLIRQSKFLQAQISQIYVNSKGEFDLIPQVGNQLIRFGHIDSASEKLKKLEVFYKKALVKEGWDKYKTINLKYKDQVVCSKK
jgi:cell division protein FtsQ